MATGWEQLGAALGGDSESAYQEGRFMGAKTEDALASARERVEKNAARARLESDLVAAGTPREQARAASTALSAGGGIDDPISMMLKSQEYGFRAKAGDPNVPLDIGQRSLLGVANGPVEPIYKVGDKAINKFETPNLDDLGSIVGETGGGGRSAFMQALQAYGVLGPDGRVIPGKEALAYEIQRNTDKVFDVEGQAHLRSGNPFGGVQPPAPGGPGPAAPGPAAPFALAPLPTVTSNAAAVAAAKEQGQAVGRNAAGLETTNSTIDQFVNNIDNFLAKPGYDNLYGNVQGTEVGKTVMGLADQDVADARGAIETLGGEAFLASIQKMRGFGQLSNQEGLKVQTALTRALDTRLSSADSRAAWAEVKTRMAELKRVAAIEAGQGGSMQAPPPAPAAGADGWQNFNGVRIRVKPQ